MGMKLGRDTSRSQMDERSEKRGKIVFEFFQRKIHQCICFPLSGRKCPERRGFMKCMDGKGERNSLACMGRGGKMETFNGQLFLRGWKRKR